MSEMGNSSKSNATEKMVFIHIIFVVGVSVAFGAVNLISGAVAIGIMILLTGIGAGAVTYYIKDRSTTTTRGIILSTVQMLIIVVMSTAKHELNNVFPLMVAATAMSGIYFSKKNIVIQIIVMNVPTILGIFLNDFFYSGIGFDVILKGLMGINVGAFIIMYLVKCSLKLINESVEAGDETERLLIQVRKQMTEGEEMMKQQTQVVDNIAEISQRVNTTSSLMLEIANKLNSASEEQEQTIAEITESVAEISTETERGLSESKNASKAALKSTELVHESNKEMQNMLTAMSEITVSSHKIESIIKTIEDIAFQTNILALNAAVEAARAGAAGKGFAVVADEVRNLANRSAEAVQNTSTLIKSSIESVEKGTVLAKQVAEKMGGVMEISESSANHAKHITELTERQTQAIESVRSQLEQISIIISQNSQTSVESADIARSVANEASMMDEIVKDFRS